MNAAEDKITDVVIPILRNLQEDVSGLKQDMSMVKSNVENLKDSVSRLEGAVRRVDLKVDSIDSQMRFQVTRTYVHEDEIQELRARIEVLEDRNPDHPPPQ
jgi:predicted  nucleic acid-binding Zn-ribbon protein